MTINFVPCVSINELMDKKGRPLIGLLIMMMIEDKNKEVQTWVDIISPLSKIDVLEKHIDQQNIWISKDKIALPPARLLQFQKIKFNDFNEL